MRQAGNVVPPIGRFWFLVLALTVWPIEVEAAVVVLFNQTDQQVVFQADSGDGEAQQHALAPGRLTRLIVAGDLSVRFARGGRTIRRVVEPNTVYQFSGQSDGLHLGPLFEGMEGGLFLADIPDGDGPPPPVIIPVKLFVDDEQRAETSIWLERLRRVVAAASRFVEIYGGARFEVTAVGRWESNDKLRKQSELEAEFGKQASLGEARLAIGFSRQLGIGKKNPYAPPSRTPLFSHLLLPDVQEAVPTDLQLVLLVHELGHYLGATHDNHPSSVMQPAPFGIDPRLRRSGGITFDPANTLAMNLTVGEMRRRGSGRPDVFSRGVRLQLLRLYRHLGDRLPEDRQVATSIGWTVEPAISRTSYTARFVDGTQVDSAKITKWNSPGAGPCIGGRPLFDPDLPVRWFRWNLARPVGVPRERIEFFGGDCLPGRVVAWHDGSSHLLGIDHLEVTPLFSVALEDAHYPAALPIRTDSIRRIVFKPITTGYHPGTAFLRNGSREDFQAARFAEKSVLLLRDSGIQERGFEELAELHLPQRDPWESHWEQIARTLNGRHGRLVRWETVDHLRATAARATVGSIPIRDGTGPTRYTQYLLPPWSLSRIRVRFDKIRMRTYFSPEEIPLSRIALVHFEQHSDLAGYRPVQVDHNVAGGPLAGGGRLFAFGFGVHASTRLDFRLPVGSRALETHLGLDQSVGAGGCVRARIYLDSIKSKPLYDSGLLIGSTDAARTGPLPIAGGSRLILHVDSAHDQTPPGADPMDIRDLFNWYEPILHVDPAWLRGELERRATQP